VQETHCTESSCSSVAWVVQKANYVKTIILHTSAHGMHVKPVENNYEQAHPCH